MTATAAAPEETIGMMVKRWRERRRRSQLDLSLAAEMSTRHLSYIETGRSNPSPAMIERICDELDVPLRERNRFHLAAGFAPAYRERPLTDLGAAQDAVRAVLAGMEHHPAVAVNVHWDLLAANQAMEAFLRDLPGELRRPPVNMLRATLHPDGLAARIMNLGQWRSHVVRRVRRQLERTAADGLAALLAELEAYGPPSPTTGPAADGTTADDLVVPLRMATPYGDLALLYTATVFGSPRDVTLDEIAIETFFPADQATAQVLRSLADLRTAPRAETPT
ncbi:helix-turn-helix domain-containing protein [Actinopolymorpha singaporensis]|uniref:Transcriptional regulator, contains XRE-family HTH domain n=1 Tax=Actinopolymorpha singaporensis TaxID=117157 RepID=A0A1H1XRX1_9ACTN|nr:helix-turn-helix transcriptional regulator [Actinopolymorpha singaporensis]SDT12004.1 Transcriptional regulator, contains XRE-family HTH domain [Actinopolymorpha singaporensis]